jgi:ABC-2 type transport system permease protein
MFTIFRKELADYFTSIRCLVVLLLVFAISALALHAAYMGLRQPDTANVTEFVFLGLFTTPEEAIPALLNFPTIMALFFMPFIGIALGFDAINSERARGTLSRVLSQPVFRDNVINAKFLASIFTLSIMAAASMLIVGGYGLRLIGVPPGSEEFIRLFIYLVSLIIYGAFWIGLAMLFSVVFRWVGSSLLTSLAFWLFFGLFYIFMVAPALANAMAPTASGTTEALIQNYEMQQLLLRISPSYLFLESSTALLFPLVRTLGVVTMAEVTYMLPNPLSLGQSLLLVWPHLTILIGLTAACFGVSYVVFMRQEIRAT